MLKRGEIWLADLNTHKFTQLTTSPNIDTAPVWSDGNIYYVSQSEGTNNLFEINPATKASKEVTHFDLPVRNCTIELDGRPIAVDGVLQGDLS